MPWLGFLGAAPAQRYQTKPLYGCTHSSIPGAGTGARRAVQVSPVMSGAGLCVLPSGRDSAGADPLAQQDRWTCGHLVAAAHPAAPAPPQLCRPPAPPLAPKPQLVQSFHHRTAQLGRDLQGSEPLLLVG